MCIFPGGMTSKRVNVGSPGADAIVSSDTQCRACSAEGDAEPVNDLQRALLNHECIAGSADCRYIPNTDPFRQPELLVLYWHQ